SSQLQMRTAIMKRPVRRSSRLNIMRGVIMRIACPCSTYFIVVRKPLKRAASCCHGPANRRCRAKFDEWPQGRRLQVDLVQPSKYARSHDQGGIASQSRGLDRTEPGQV